MTFYNIVTLVLYKDITKQKKKYSIACFQYHKRRESKIKGVNMANFEKLLTLFFFIIIPNIVQVDANFFKSMHITWGAQHALLQGDDLQLMLDESSGGIKI